jgi:Prenyltransferase and squalene oxidase repeat
MTRSVLRLGAPLAVAAWLFAALAGDEEKPPKDEAVTRGLDWLAKQQKKDGSWAAWRDAPVADRTTSTAVALLAFLGAGHSHSHGDHAKVVKAGPGYLQKAQDRKTGRFAESPVAHALATLALTECYALTADAALRRPAQKAADAVVAGQGAKGGWPAKAGGAADPGATTWSVVALRNAQMAGLKVPRPTLRQAERYFDSLPAKQPREAAAMAAYCRLLLGATPRDAKLTAWADSLGKQPAPAATSAEDFFTLLALRHFSPEKHKARWDDKKVGRPALVARQSAKTGAWAGTKGTLQPDSDVVETAVALLRLEMPLRELPLFGRHARPRGGRP